MNKYCNAYVKHKYEAGNYLKKASLYIITDVTKRRLPFIKNIMKAC